MAARLAALIVNYNSGAYALGLARSLRRQWREMGRDDQALELVVVDNASRAADAAALEALRREGARVDVCDSNLGYAVGMNRALAHTQGAGDDLVLVLNPDLALFPGCLARLLATHAATARLGALAPRAFLDPARQWRMPPNRLPTLSAQALDESAAEDPRLAAQLSRRRTRHALREWLAEQPLEVEMLSGACLLLSRGAIDAAGGLFDPRYPLYYEDSDLCRRLERSGLRLVLEPRAEIVHHWARSSGIESQDPEPLRRHALSRAAFFERWPADQFEPASAAQSDGEPFPAFASLGAVEAAPQLLFPHHGRWLVEVAMVATFPLAAGALVEAQRWQMDERAWEWFYRGRYFLRAHDLNSPNTSAAWWLDKPSAARTKPLEPNELTALGSMPS